MLSNVNISPPRTTSILSLLNAKPLHGPLRSIYLGLTELLALSGLQIMGPPNAISVKSAV